jgi:glycogen phosphorylase
MKAVMNGGIIMGTLDGANIEISEQVGVENMFVFGNTIEDLNAIRERGYDSTAIIRDHPELAAVVDRITTMSGGIFQPIVDILTRNDRYFHCADFASYIAAQQRAADTWTNTEEWTRMSILNTARSGYFSAESMRRRFGECEN